MYMVVIGFLITLIAGYLISRLLTLLKVERPDKIYLNKTTKTVNPDLLFPPLARYYRKRANLESENNSFVSFFFLFKNPGLIFLFPKQVESNSMEAKITTNYS